jgi:hypothetical protein
VYFSSDPKYIDVRFLVDIPLLLHSLSFHYPHTVSVQLNSVADEIRNASSEKSLHRKMLKAFTSIMIALSARSTENYAWAASVSCLLETTELTHSQAHKLMLLGLDVSQPTLLHFIKTNGEVFQKQLAAVRLFLLSISSIVSVK